MLRLPLAIVLVGHLVLSGCVVDTDEECGPECEEKADWFDDLTGNGCVDKAFELPDLPDVDQMHVDIREFEVPCEYPSPTFSPFVLDATIRNDYASTSTDEKRCALALEQRFRDIYPDDVVARPEALSEYFAVPDASLKVYLSVLREKDFGTADISAFGNWYRFSMDAVAIAMSDGTCLLPTRELAQSYFSQCQGTDHGRCAGASVAPYQVD